MCKSVTNAHGDSDSCCQRNTDGNGNRDGHCHCNSDCHADAHRVANTKDYANSKSASDSSASALTLTDRILDHNRCSRDRKIPAACFPGIGRL